MSKYNPLSPCPFCGSEVERDGGYVFQCTNGACDAQIMFCNRYYKGNPRRVTGAYNRRCSGRSFEYILIGAALALIITVIFCMLFVTYRAENVSRETYTPQSDIAQQAAEQGATEYANRLYTDADAVALAQMAYGECRGVAPVDRESGIISARYQQACAMWVVLNRFDAGFEGERIVDIVAAPSQFHGYDPEHPISEELLALAYDVLDRWQAEKLGAADAGRVLPAEYLFFVGDGQHNNFTVDYGSGDYYTWMLPDPYAEEGDNVQ